MTRLLAAALAALTLAVPAQASSVSVFNQDAERLDFEAHKSGAGTFGVEFQRTDQNDWVRVGTATNGEDGEKSQETPNWGKEKLFFEFVYGADLSTIRLSQDDSFRNPVTAEHFIPSFTGFNAIIFESKERPVIELASFNGMNLGNIDIATVGGDKWSKWDDVVLVSDDLENGFTLGGRINMFEGQGTINFALGRATVSDVDAAYRTVAPIPVPAALPLLLAGLGGLMLLRRYRRG